MEGRKRVVRVILYDEALRASRFRLTCYEKIKNGETFIVGDEIGELLCLALRDPYILEGEHEVIHLLRMRPLKFRNPEESNWGDYNSSKFTTTLPWEIRLEQLIDPHKKPSPDFTVERIIMRQKGESE